MGATLVTGGANFSILSRSAGSIELLLFDRVDTQGRLSVLITPECDLRNVGFTSSASLIIPQSMPEKFLWPDPPNNDMSFRPGSTGLSVLRAHCAALLRALSRYWADLQ